MSLRGIFLPSYFFTLFCILSAVGQAQTVIHVPADQPTIQAGINVAHNGDTVMVAAGTYYENIDFKGKAITVTSSDGAATTIIDGQHKTAAVLFGNGETSSAVLNGFTVRNGGALNGDRLPNGTVVITAAVSATSASPTITNNVVTQASCIGMYFAASSALVQNNEIDHTLPLTPGGSSECQPSVTAILAYGGSDTIPLHIKGNLIQNNTQPMAGNLVLGGAGIFIRDTGYGNNAAPPIIEGNTLRNNISYGPGGAIDFFEGRGFIVGNLIYNNQSFTDAGAIAISYEGYYLADRGYIANNTIVDNTRYITSTPCTSNICRHIAQVDVAAGWIDSDAFVNNIVSGNNSEAAIGCGGSGGFFNTNVISNQSWTIDDHNLLYNPGGPLYDPSTCAREVGEYGNIGADPRFVDPAANNYHLQPGSPAIDHGNNSVFAYPENFAVTFPAPLPAPITFPTDFDGNARIQNATGIPYPTIDIGAFETAGPQTPKPTTILLTVPVPDPGFTVGSPTGILTATLRSPYGVPPGTVTFVDNGTPAATVSIDASGTATTRVSGLVPGTLHNYVAVYAGQGPYTPATSVKIILYVQATPTTLTLTSLPNPSRLNESVTFTVTPHSSDNAVLSPILLYDDTAGVLLTTLTPGTTAPVTYATSSLATGSHLIRAYYPGDTQHGSTSSNLTQAVNSVLTSTALTSSVNPSIYGHSVTFTAKVTAPVGIPTGSITFYDGTTALAIVNLDPSATATYTTTSLSVGSHSIAASYAAGIGFSPSNDFLAQQVTPGLPTSITLTPSQNPAAYHQSLSITATLASASAIPLGTLTISEGATVLASETITGPGWPPLTFTTANLSAGTHPLIANYTPDSAANTAASTASIAEVVLPPASVTAVAATPNPVTSFQPVTLTATVTAAPGVTGAGTPSGSVTFFAGTTLLGSASLNTSAIAVLTTRFPAGTYALTARFDGTANFATSTSTAIAEVVTASATNTAVAASPNPAIQRQNVTLTATVVPASIIPPITGVNTTPTGSVIFYDSANVIATSSLGATGVATASTTSLPPGIHNITTAYSGDANFLASTSAALSLTITPSDYTISAPAISIQAEHHAPLTIAITTTGGLTDTLNLSCGNLPQWAICYFDQSSIALDSSTATYNTTVVIDTDEVRYFAGNTSSPGHKLPITLAAVFIGAAAFLRRRRTRISLLVAVLMIAAAATTLSGCTGQYPEHTAVGTYNIQINGITTNGQIAHSANVSLTVTQ